MIANVTVVDQRRRVPTMVGEGAVCRGVHQLRLRFGKGGDTTGCVLNALDGEAYSPFGEGSGGPEGIRTVCLFAIELTRDMECGTRCTGQWQRTDAALFVKVGESILRWHVCGGRKPRWTVLVHNCQHYCWQPKLVSQSETPQMIVSPTAIRPSQ